MKNFIAKFVAVLAIVASIAATAPQVSAGGGGFSHNWTDISSLIAERQNRPIWAMAYAAPYWYMTDGQDLWTGGHVWRTEGTAMADITTDVRNAGISRVDDIVSDGQTVLFLKGVMAKNNSFEVLKFTGSYTNVSSILRNQLNSDEGIISLNGKDGMWAMVTSKGRVYLWNSGTGNVTSIIGNTINYPDYLNYSVYKTSPSQGISTYAFAVPVSAGWFIGQRQGGYDNWGTMKYWLRDINGSLIDVTSKFHTSDGIEFVASNGNKALFLATYDPSYRGNATSRMLFTYDGVTVADLSTQYYGADSTFNWRRAIAAYDGSSWLVVERGDNSISQRSVLQINTNYIYKRDDVKDYFINMASNANGTILLGGVESEVGNANPNSPLMAKLAKASSTYSSNGTTSNGSFGGGTTYSSSAGPNVTTAGNPSNYTVNNGGTFVYRATASDSNGVNRVSLYVDGSLAKTCYSDTCEYSNVYYSNSLSTRNIPVYAIAMDNQGYTTQTSNEYLKVQGTGTNGQQNSTQNSSSGTYYWSYFDPNQTTLQRGNTMTYNVGANDSDGLKKIELYVNGQLKRTCDLGRSYGNHVCGQTIYGTDYLSGSSLALNARVLDYSDKETWVPVQTIYITDGNGSNTTGDISTWTWLDPSGSTLNRTSNTTFRVQASATQGLNTMEVYVNGTLKRTCNFSRVYGTQNCDLTIYGSDYTNGSLLSLNAKATDYNGKTAWSDNKSLTVQDNGTYSTDVTISGLIDPKGSSGPTVATLWYGNSTNYRVQASAVQGLNRIEVYVGGTLKRTCNFSRAYGTQNCDLTINSYDYSSVYSAGTRVTLSARATDYNGKTAWTDEELVFDGQGQNSNTNASVGLQASPNQTTFSNGDQVTFNGSAQDADGLARIEVLFNGSVAKTCYFSNSTNWETCAYTTNVYSDGSNSKSINAAVNAFDRYGNSRGVNPIYYTVNGYTGSNNNSNTNPTTWAWSEPNENLTIATNGNATYHVGAWDQDGLKRIDMYVNGIYANTCNFGSAAYGNRECQITINGSSYKNGDKVYVNAKAVDALDRESWTTPRTYTISGTGGTTGNGNATYTWVWATPDVNTVTSGQSVKFNVGASDADGIRKIEILGNGTVMKTCDLGLAYGNQQCSIDVSTTYPGTTYANYSGRVTDGNYATTNSETKSFTITNPTQTADKVGTLYAWSSRDYGYGANDTITFTAQGNDADGIDRIELFVNANLVKTCYGSGTVSCTWIGGPYPDRNTVTYAARMVDKTGHNYITGYKTIDKK
ncbi:Ig-like domain-containing protein [Candidatus Uhrbacteria bacterium]|nr:Ig-like domain-containing protein [Candidatus Uhrbacteria bacterium]